MAVTKLSNSGIATGGVLKYDSMLAGNEAFSPSSFESIATAVGNGSSQTITFSSIPQTYKHLQLRIIGNTPLATTTTTACMIFNGDSGANYTGHWVYGANNSAAASGSATRFNIWVALYYPGSNYASDYHGVSITNILDYTSNTKNKTVTSSGGVMPPVLTTAVINSVSGAWVNTSPITSLTVDFQGNTISTTSQFALYGIKDS